MAKIYVNDTNGALLVFFLKVWIYLIDIYILGSPNSKIKKVNKIFLTILWVSPLPSPPPWDMEGTQNISSMTPCGKHELGWKTPMTPDRNTCTRQWRGWTGPSNMSLLVKPQVNGLGVSWGDHARGWDWYAGNVNVILINYPDLYNAQNTDDGTNQSQQKRTLEGQT